MNKYSTTDEIRLLVPNSGDRTRVVCPSCDGGSTKERSLMVSNKNGRIAWYCFRGTCSERGNFFTAGTIQPQETEREPELRPYLGGTFPLPDEKARFLQTAYNVVGSRAGICWSMDERYLLPINTYYGDNTGWISRRPWGMADDGRPKVDTYWHEPLPLLAWNASPRFHADRAGVVLAVEDQLSAIRAHQLRGVTTVALLGTGVNQEKIAAIQKHTDNLVIALDKDATGQAFNIARKWGQAFKSCRVLILEHDIKDMHQSDLHELVI